MAVHQQSVTRGHPRRGCDRAVPGNPPLHPEHPGRCRHIEVTRCHRQQVPVAHVDLVQPPPVVVVAAHQQARCRSAAGIPARLAETLAAIAAQHQNLRAQLAVTKPVNVQAGGVPSHVGVVPRDPGQHRAVGRHPRRHHEVGSRPQQLDPKRAVGSHGHQLVGGLAASVVALPHADAPTTVGCYPPVGISPGPGLGRLGGERHRIEAGAVEAPQPLISELDVVERPVVGPPGPAAVLVDRGAHIGALRRELLRPACAQIASHDRGATALVGTALGPPQQPGLHGVGNDF